MKIIILTFLTILSTTLVTAQAGLPEELPEDYFFEYYYCGYEDIRLSPKVDNFNFTLKGSFARLTINTTIDPDGTTYIGKVAIFGLSEARVAELYVSITENNFFDISITEAGSVSGETRTIYAVMNGNEREVQVIGDISTYPAIEKIERTLFEILDEAQRGWR